MIWRNSSNNVRDDDEESIKKLEARGGDGTDKENLPPPRQQQPSTTMLSSLQRAVLLEETNKSSPHSKKQSSSTFLTDTWERAAVSVATLTTETAALPWHGDKESSNHDSLSSSTPGFTGQKPTVGPEDQNQEFQDE